MCWREGARREERGIEQGWFLRRGTSEREGRKKKKSIAHPPSHFHPRAFLFTRVGLMERWRAFSCSVKRWRTGGSRSQPYSHREFSFHDAKKFMDHFRALHRRGIGLFTTVYLPSHFFSRSTASVCGVSFVCVFVLLSCGRVCLYWGRGWLAREGIMKMVMVVGRRSEVWLVYLFRGNDSNASFVILLLLQNLLKIKVIDFLALTTTSIFHFLLVELLLVWKLYCKNLSPYVLSLWRATAALNHRVGQ